MIIPSSSHGVIASSRKIIVAAGGGGGGDVTPNAVNWADIYYDGTIGLFLYTERQITGISSSITLKVQFTAIFGSQMFYYVSSTAGSIVSGDDLISQDPAFFGMTEITNNGTFTVSNNQYVTFGVNASCGDSFTITVKNQSDSDTTLDTFLAYYEGEC